MPKEKTKLEKANEGLAKKAINIKGKEYVLVADRIKYFNEAYPQGSIVTEIVSTEDSTYVVRADVRPDLPTDTTPGRVFTGHSQAKLGELSSSGKETVNTRAALENAETSAVGRALAMMGIGVLDSIASADELTKVGVRNKKGQIISDNPDEGAPF